ncbi:hypothetical protein ORN01_25050 [Bacillus cereus]|uniref:hypothetical protein n=1 Tax=Bacillus cereus group TaxID=86661 RepID=UPI0022E63926|nr:MULTISPECIES: hypothetical protein [Bacillus cereus group]MDA1509653.1 hypothetical protein [Bacillus cereus group sp. TH36-2LC]MDZ4632226.1 hypothetical protein [Bacillus cereus]
MLKKVLTRLKNPKVATAVVSGILMILVNVGIIDMDMSAKAMDITNIVLGLGVTVGVFGDPESHVKE